MSISTPQSDVAPAQVRLEGAQLGVSRSGKKILDSVSIAIDQPGLTIVIGPNGAGKSTLLAALAGVLPLDQGFVSLDGAPLRTIPPKVLARRRAYLPQNARCEWPISVERVVALGLTPVLPAIGDLDPADLPRIEQKLEQLDLIPLRNQDVTTLSGGELARTMLARAMVCDPDVLLADEPIAGLDPRHAFEAMNHLKAHSRKEKIVIVALHDLMLAARYADRIIALKDARIFADGPAESVLTPEILKSLFEINVRVERSEDGLNVRFIA